MYSYKTHEATLCNANEVINEPYVHKHAQYIDCANIILNCGGRAKMCTSKAVLFPKRRNISLIVKKAKCRCV